MAKKDTKIIKTKEENTEAIAAPTPVAEEEKVTKISLSRKPKAEAKAEKTEPSVKEEPKEEKTKPSAAKSEKQVAPSESKKPRSKKYQSAVENIDKTKTYSLKEALELLQKTSYTKFIGSVEAHLNTNVKSVRGLVNLPFAAGKKLTILAFGDNATEAGADTQGSDETIEEISKGKINFDVLVTTPQWMPKLARVAKVLGPKGLMPNPKNDTVTDNLAKTITELQAGKTEYKTESNGQVVHLAVGKVNQPTDEIAANVKALYFAVGRGKVTKVTLSPTMGPGVKIQLSSI